MPVLFLAIAVGIGAIIFGTPGRKILKRRKRIRRPSAGSWSIFRRSGSGSPQKMRDSKDES
jgi:hypothetical protein